MKQSRRSTLPKRKKPLARTFVDMHFQIRDRLHTDILEERYGPIAARVLRHDNSVRAAHLVDAKGISRTFAVTFFPPQGHKGETAHIDAEIRRGEPIGKAFRKHDFAIRKNVTAVLVVPIPKWLQEAFRLREPKAKVRFSEFFARRGNEKPIVYGQVAEIYSPDFRPASVNAVDRSQVNPPTRTLEAAGFSKEEIWRRLGAYNEWGDVKEDYLKAKKASRRESEKLLKKITDFLNSLN